MALHRQIPALWGKFGVKTSLVGQIWGKFLWAVLSSPDRELNHHPCKSEDDRIYHLLALFSSAISKKIKE